jgi:hypothetical protein
VIGTTRGCARAALDDRVRLALLIAAATIINIAVFVAKE